MRAVRVAFSECQPPVCTSLVQIQGNGDTKQRKLNQNRLEGVLCRAKHKEDGQTAD